MLSDTQVDRIVGNIMSTNGATFNASGLFSYMKGYQVGVNGMGIMHDLPVGDTRRSEVEWMVRHFITKRSSLFEDGFDLGAWISDGVLYLDVTRHYSDCELALQRAGEFGEQAIWDWSTMSEVPVKLMDKLSFTR